MKKWQAIVKGKCPKCRQGNMFESFAYRLSDFHKMNARCSNCGLKYEVEPGFFVGAMYVNYAFTIAVIVAVSAGLNIFGAYSLRNFIISIITAILLLLPLLFRYSRILFLHLFGGVSYVPGLDGTPNQS